MALFKRGKGKDAAKGSAGANDVYPVPGKTAFCKVCNSDQQFSRVWHRAERLRQCPDCSLVFNVDHDPYQRFQPACPQCKAPVESDGFEYGYCDGCGSKYELADGTKPGLLPNKAQREAMDRVGRAWSKD
jgi:uncharacterized protein YbaR (Trm112 family)